jgi:hypothetical protein
MGYADVYVFCLSLVVDIARGRFLCLCGGRFVVRVRWQTFQVSLDRPLVGWRVPTICKPVSQQSDSPQDFGRSWNVDKMYALAELPRLSIFLQEILRDTELETDSPSCRHFRLWGGSFNAV